MTTAARTNYSQASHWYDIQGNPRYEIIGSTTGTPRRVTIKDAKENNWLPSVTNILSILEKPALTAWKIENAVLACLTTPRKEGEQIDAFVYRVLHEDKVQDQESQIARDCGTEIHDALEKLANGEPINPAIAPWVQPAWQAIQRYGKVIASEKVLIGPGYGGRCDLIIESDSGSGCKWIVDWKSAKKLPKDDAWPEHRLQLAAYAKALYDETGSVINTANVYISTLDCGKFVVCNNPDYYDAYTYGFAPIVTHWQFIKGYKPKQ